MKRWIGITLVCLPLVAMADEMADGFKAWEKQDYATAHRIFNKLASEGNAEAQRQLGEMIGFGDGVAEDPALAEQWLKRAMAGGNAEARQSLAMVQERTHRKADIAWYTTSYDGADIKLASFHCEMPTIPQRSETKEEVRKLDQKITAWLGCYDQFSKKLAAQLPVGKAIPEQVASVMNTRELDQARSRMDQVYKQEAADARKQAMALIDAQAAWAKNTGEYVKEASLITANVTRQIPSAAPVPPPPPQPIRSSK